jgi:hypothetical protein
VYPVVEEGTQEGDKPVNGGLLVQNVALQRRILISLRLLRVLLTLTNPVLLFVGDPFVVIGFSLGDKLGNGDLASTHPYYDVMTTDGEGEGE